MIHQVDKWELRLKAELTKAKLDLDKFVAKACAGLNINHKKIINDLLSDEDKQDIINGYVAIECMRQFIKLWIEQGNIKYAR